MFQVSEHNPLDTGCGKTTAVQLLSMVKKNRLDILNCHATTETSDLLGNLRPVRGREALEKTLLRDVIDLREKAETVLAPADFPSEMPSSDTGFLENTTTQQLHTWAGSI